MIYLDNGATSFPKPQEVSQAVARALSKGPIRGEEATGRLWRRATWC